MMIHQVQTGAQIILLDPAKRIEAAKGITFFTISRESANLNVIFASGIKNTHSTLVLPSVNRNIYTTFTVEMQSMQA